MNVERVKYVIWAADMNRAIEFYTTAFNAEVAKRSETISEINILDATIGIHGGGEGKRTWTGISFQVPDVVTAAAEIENCGGALNRPIQEEDEGEAPPLAMVRDTEGNEFMLFRQRDLS